MPKKRFSAEQIVTLLRQIEVAMGQGKSAQLACREAGISEQSYYRWRKEYGGLQLEQAKRMKDLEKENARLKRLVADLSLEKQVWKGEAVKQSIQWIDCRPNGSPWENGYCESFNGKLRDELLNGEIFCSLREAKVLIEQWRHLYNTVRPHSSLGYRPPAPQAYMPVPPHLDRTSAMQ